MPTQKFWIKGLAHEDEESVACRIRELDGVLFVAMNHQDQCAEVEFEDDRASLEEIRAAAAELGYEVEIAG
jgi:copper chaperone CopZ